MIRSIFYLAQMVTIVLLTTGCLSTQTIPPASATPDLIRASPTHTRTQIPSITLTSTRTIITTGPPTFTPFLPTVTLSPTSTLLPPTPTQTLTPAPTLTKAQSENYLFKLLKDNAGCKLPCWWGIIPGVTAWEDTRKLIEYMGARTGNDPLGNGQIYHGTGGFDWSTPFTVNNIDFFEEKGVVEGFAVSGAANMDWKFFRTLWKSYSPEQVITKYGKPTRIRMSVFVYGETGFISSRLTLIYDEGQFSMEYETQALEVDVQGKPMFRVCPSWEDITWVPKLNLHILSPDSTMNLDEYVKLIAGYDISRGKSIEEAVGISIEEFYQRFFPGHGPACFETPQEMWK
jgi:hypothetical protein